MRYLSYHPTRRKQWTEHKGFPFNSIKYMVDNPYYLNLDALRIFEINEDRTGLRFIPREEWPDA